MHAIFTTRYPDDELVRSLQDVGYLLDGYLDPYGPQTYVLKSDLDVDEDEVLGTYEAYVQLTEGDLPVPWRLTASVAGEVVWVEEGLFTSFSFDYSDAFPLYLDNYFDEGCVPEPPTPAPTPAPTSVDGEVLSSSRFFGRAIRRLIRLLYLSLARPRQHLSARIPAVQRTSFCVAVESTHFWPRVHYISMMSLRSISTMLGWWRWRALVLQSNVVDRDGCFRLWLTTHPYFLRLIRNADGPMLASTTCCPVNHGSFIDSLNLIHYVRASTVCRVPQVSVMLPS